MTGHGAVDAHIDWAALRSAAKRMTERSYAPYSGVRVGTAGLTDDGRMVLGANVENASYGVTLCAECSLVSHLVCTHSDDDSRGKSPRLVAVCTVAGDGDPIAPCGRCRQVLFEFGGGDLLIDAVDGPLPLSALLPWAFGPDDVAARRDRA